MNANARALLCCITLSSLFTAPTSALADVVAYWRFEQGPPDAAASGVNSVLDSSGNALNGTPINGPVYRSNVPPFGNVHPNSLSMEFDGSSQRVFVPDGPLFQLTQSFTIEAFIFTRPLLNGEFGGNVLFRGDDRISLDPYRLTLDAPGNVVKFQVMDASGQFASVSATIPFNEWLHVAGVLDDSSGSMKLYVDGSLVNSTTTTIRPFALLDPTQNPGLGIGGLQSSNSQEYFNGFIDELRLSNAALLPSEMLIPEPSSLALMLLGFVLLLHRGSRRGGLALKLKPCPYPRSVQNAGCRVKKQILISSSKSSNKLLAVADLDSDTWVGEVKRIRGKKLPLTDAGVHALRDEYTCTIEPSRAIPVETLKLECPLSDLVNQAYGLTPAEIDPLWKIAPPRMPIPPPAT